MAGIAQLMTKRSKTFVQVKENSDGLVDLIQTPVLQTPETISENLDHDFDRGGSTAMLIHEGASREELQSNVHS